MLLPAVLLEGGSGAGGDVRGRGQGCGGVQDAVDGAAALWRHRRVAMRADLASQGRNLA